MREISFNAYHPKIGYKEVIGIEMFDDKITQVNVRNFGADLLVDGWWKLMGEDLEELELLQNTGIKDKTGTKLYEKDEVKYFYSDDDWEIGVVRFEEGSYVLYDTHGNFLDSLYSARNVVEKIEKEAE
jgi:hypothetical protein